MSSRLGYLPPHRHRSVTQAAVWPWQIAPTVPKRPPAKPRFSSADKGPQSRVEAAVNSEVCGLPGFGSEKSGGVVDTLHGTPGGEDLEPDAGEKATALELVPHDDGQQEEDIWPYMTTKEKRRLWLRRRQMGEFYFRSEFKGLVHAVMVSRGWKPSCPPRVSNEELTTPYVESWEEEGTIARPSTLSAGQQDPPLQPRITPNHADGSLGDLGGSEPGAPAAPAAPELHEEDSASLGRGRQWDVHWSYTKWAVETMRFARKLAPWQRVNHFRNTNELCRKDLMLKNLKKRRAQLKSQGELTEAKEYNFFPVSFEMPKDYALFVEAFRETGGTWIMKPSGSAEGRGIFLFSRLSDVKAWAKPHLIRGMKRHDPANPGSYVVQRYISNPYTIGGKKFDLRLYVLVTSFRPLTVYIYRDGFAKFSSTRFSADPVHLKNDLMHLTNHAVQRRGTMVGKKWSLKKFKYFVAMRHGQKSMDELFWEIQALMVRTLRAVDRLIVSDRQSFELFGYDVMVDENLRPWLLEVNASPSLGASNKNDLRLKKQMVGHVFDIIDVEGRISKWTPVREHVGGFDLAYHKGYVELHPRCCGHSSLFGAVARNPVMQCRRARADKDKFSVFPVPRAAGTSRRMREAQAQHDRMPLLSPVNGSLEGDIDASWRPSILMVRPKDRWRGLVNYVPWKVGDEVDTFRAVGGGPMDASLRKFDGDGRLTRERSSCRGGKGIGRTCTVIEGAGVVREDYGVAERKDLVLGAEGQVDRQPDPPTLMPGVAGESPVGDSETLVKGVGGGIGCRVHGSVGPNPRRVENVLHGVMDALRKVREARDCRGRSRPDKG